MQGCLEPAFQSNVSPTVVYWLVGFAIANAGALFGAYVSIVTRLAVVEVNVDRLKADVNGVGAKVRNLKTAA